MEPLTTLARWIREAQRIVFLTGAGISTDSGIPDFRSEDGLWTKDPDLPQKLSRAYFHRRPREFWKVFRQAFPIEELAKANPNEGHRFLAELEKMGKDVVVITQNIDGLHQKAGSRNVLELHGTLFSATCPTCNAVYFLPMEEDVPRCTQEHPKGVCGSILKPDVVLFGDPVQHFQEAVERTQHADLFVAMGTSLEVSPANAFPLYARGKKVLINRDETLMDGHFDLVIRDAIRDVISAIQNELPLRH